MTGFEPTTFRTPAISFANDVYLKRLLLLLLSICNKIISGKIVGAWRQWIYHFNQSSCSLYTLFFIRTSKFCRSSLFLIFWLLQPQFVLNFVLISVSGLKWEIKKTKDKALKNNADRLYFEEISVYLSKITVLAHWLQKSMFCCPTILQDSVKFQLETFSDFSSFSLSLFLNCS